jgi:uncharacterized protein (TIGR03083 family)
MTAELGPLGCRYLDVHESFVALVEPLSEAAFRLRVPSCPSWTVHDLVAHVSGVTDDFVHGRMDGAATDPWTGAQVERSRDTPTRAMLARWREQAPDFANVLDLIAEARPIMDTHTHEHDVRGAVGLPGNRHGEAVTWIAPRLAESISTERPLVIRMATCEVVVGPPDGELLEVELSEFELMRSRLGRRSRAQLAAYRWTGEPGPLLDDWFIFGPAGSDLVE